MPSDAVRRRRKVSAFILGFVVLAGVFIFQPKANPFPSDYNFGLSEPTDDLQRWLIRNRKDHAIFTYFFDPLSEGIDYLLENIETGLLKIPALTIIAAAVLTAYKTSSIQTAILCLLCLLLIGAFQLWENSMETLSLILLSMLFSLLIGIPLGIAMAFNRQVELAMRPILDMMQTLPTFVYLIPAILFFGVAGVPSLVATVIYAMPPAARLTFLGLRQIPTETLEAAHAFGSTPRQMLWKVQLPLALPSIMAGVNQTIMMALSMVVIAALIGADGLGREVLFALRRLRVGQAMEAGLAIVAMAIVLDRLTYALSRVEPRRPFSFRLLPAAFINFARAHAMDAGLDKLYRLKPPYRPPLLIRERAYWIGSTLFLILLTLVLRQYDRVGFPENWYYSIREPVDEAVEWAQINLYDIRDSGIGTGSFSDFMTLQLLNPLHELLIQIPWWIFITLVGILGFGMAGWRLGGIAVTSLLVIGLLGMWEYGMDTLSQVLAAVFFSLIIGIPIGILAVSYPRIERGLRPILDTLQTIPTFVYLVPMIMLFNLGRVPGVVASILYALPPVIRLTALGIRRVDATVMEASRSFGSSSMQLLWKVQLPLALPSIMAGVNQTIMMVLAMVVVAGLVGGQGLGLEVVSALSENELGRGLEAGLAIVALAVVLDRITQGWSLRRQKLAM